MTFLYAIITFLKFFNCYTLAKISSLKLRARLMCIHTFLAGCDRICCRHSHRG